MSIELRVLFLSIFFIINSFGQNWGIFFSVHELKSGLPSVNSNMLKNPNLILSPWTQKLLSTGDSFSSTLLYFSKELDLFINFLSFDIRYYFFIYHFHFSIFSWYQAQFSNLPKTLFFMTGAITNEKISVLKFCKCFFCLLFFERKNYLGVGGAHTQEKIQD